MTKNERLKYIIIVLILLTIAAYLMASFMENFFAAGDVAVIKINGMILADDAKMIGQEVTASKDIVQFIEQADQDSGIKAIMFEINSGGGSAVASKEIADAIKRTNKTTISLIREVGASGAYWIASATDTIIANEMSITGSIGVISSYLDFSGFLDRYNVTYQRLVAGEYKDIGTPFKELTETEESILQKKLDRIHDYFIDAVANNRNLKRDYVVNLSTGMFYLGDEAKDYGLVDMLGDRHTAKEYLKQKLNQTEITFVEFETEVSFIDAITGVFSRKTIGLENEGIFV